MEDSSITIVSNRPSNSNRLSERCRSNIQGRNAELRLLKSSLKGIQIFNHQGERQHLDQNETLNRSSSDSAPNQSRITFFEAVEKNESNNEDNVFGRESGRSFIFVQGESGTGKTTLVRNFLVAVASKETPIVFFWDDLQWIDAASFEVLKAMSLNCALRHFLFVGSFRIDEVSDDHIVKGFINGLPHPILITTTNLTSSDLSNMLRVVFGLRDHHKERIKRVQELAELLHRRTDGNIFYVLEILDYLQAAELLTYDTLNFRWIWNVNRIQTLQIYQKI